MKVSFAAHSYFYACAQVRANLRNAPLSDQELNNTLNLIGVLSHMDEPECLREPAHRAARSTYAELQLQFSIPARVTE
jgi:hypothetical protein